MTYKRKSSWLDSFFELCPSMMLVFLLSEYLACHYIQKELILTEQLYINSWSEQMTVDRIREILVYQDQWKWIGYIVILIFIFVKLVLTTICLNIGTFLMEYKVGFGQLWRIVVNSTAVFAIGKVLYTVQLARMDIQHIEDVEKADIFSLLGMIGYDQVPQWAVFALGSMNLLELFYWVLLSLGIMWGIKLRWGKSIGFVALTYGMGLWIWLLAGTFLMINLYGD